MTTLRRIALLNAVESPPIRESTARLMLVARRFGIEARAFARSEEILEYAPDCVLVSSCQDAKLTPFPTYGLLVPPAARYLQTPRFTRNVLTYDACLTLSPDVTRFVRDLAFGARKFSCPVARFAATVQTREFVPHEGQVRLAYVGANSHPGRTIPVIASLLREEALELRGPHGAWECVSGGASPSGPVPFDGESVLQVYRQAGAGFDLTPPEAGTDTPSTRLLEIVAASAVAITTRQPAVERVFGDTLLYVDDTRDAEAAAEQLRHHLASVRAKPAAAVERARAAHRIFCDTLALDRLFPALLELHDRVLVEKGYQPDPDPAYEQALPSVTYIVRTGGGRSLTLLRRALDSLVAQQYPKLEVLLVLFRDMPEAAGISQEYSTLLIRTLTGFDGPRSRPIRAGMQAVETELFGLLDDDDVLSPNHVRMLVKALQCQHRFGWRGSVRMAYSGSVEVWDSQPPPGDDEREDELALERVQRRRLEHYRLYSPSEMSRHRWFLINSFLAERSLVDAELLEDPSLDTGEDLYLALLMAQRTFLAFSGEVTMNHCYQSTSTTFHNERWHNDALRCAARQSARLFPAESACGLASNPLAAREPLETTPPDVATEPTWRLALRETGREADDGGGQDSAAGRRELTGVVDLEAGLYTLSVQLRRPGAHGDAGAHIRVEVTEQSDPARTLAAALFLATDLERQGDVWTAAVRFGVMDAMARIQLRLHGQPAGVLAASRVTLNRHANALVPQI